VTIGYFIKQFEIIEQFCINKEEPQLKCKGKCYLTTKLTTLDENQEEEPFSPNNNSINLELQYTIVDAKIKLSAHHYFKKTFLTHKLLNTTFEGYYSIVSPPPESKNVL